MPSCPSVQRSTSLHAFGTAVLATVLLCACGGGIFLGYGNVGDNDRPPAVSLAVSPASAAPGQAVRLVAAASDDLAVQSVAFFRLDGGTATLLGADGAAPYEWDTALPAGAIGNVQFFARATDDAGQSTDSAAVSVRAGP